MIRFGDFVLDDIRGPLLTVGDETVDYSVCRGKRLERPGIKEDAKGEHVGTIQETSQTIRPARMAGQADLISSANGHAPNTEVGAGDRAHAIRWHRRGKG